jgi:1-deoxy-D-xylulose-5-phosphate reductoisomerase
MNPDPERCRALRLAYGAIKAGGTVPAVLNGANEEAVMAFIGEKMPFNRIVPLVEEVISRHGGEADPGIKEILAADLWARQEARKMIEGMKN